MASDDLKPYTEQRTKEVVHTTTPIFNIFMEEGLLHEGTGDPLVRLSGWGYAGFSTDATLGERVQKLSSQLGFESQHSFNNSGNRVRAWGFEYEEHPCVVFYSNEGLSLEVDPEMKPDKSRDLVGYLNQRLGVQE